MAKAVERDPSSWKLQYGLAVARAAGGLDPRGETERALRLNPTETRLQKAAAAFRAETGGRWRRAGSKMALPAPGPPIP